MSAAARSRAVSKKPTTRKRASKGNKTKEQAEKAVPKAKRKATPRKTKKTTDKAASKSRVATAKAKQAGKSPEAGVSEEILRELRSLRALIEPPSAAPVSADAALDESVLSLRRVLNELIRRQMEPVLAAVADVRASLCSAGADLQQAAERLDRLLDNFGVIRYGAEALDYPDPLIHVVVGERDDPAAPEGVVLETLDLGLRASAGVVLSKARVVVNRRS